MQTFQFLHRLCHIIYIHWKKSCFHWTQSFTKTCQVTNILPKEFWNGCKPSVFSTLRNIQWVELGREFSLWQVIYDVVELQALCPSMESHWETDSGSSRRTLQLNFLQQCSHLAVSLGLTEVFPVPERVHIRFFLHFWAHHVFIPSTTLCSRIPYTLTSFM